MHFNSDIYYGNIIKGDLHSAIRYVKQFPEKTNLYNRFMDVFAHECYISYEVDAELNNILTVYQQYYRDAFYLCIEKEQAANKLRNRLAALLGIADDKAELCDLEQNQLAELFQYRGLQFMGGKTSGYYGPYIWRTTETVSYDVELPGGIQNYTVKILDGFIVRGWIDYFTFGKIGPGGWTDCDGYINCVKSAWDLESESFRVSLLKHEAQHARDLAINKEMSSEDLEYRAKLVELIYSTERNLLKKFSVEADDSDKSNGHAMASHLIVKGFEKFLGVETFNPDSIPVEQIQSIARLLFENTKSESKPLK